MRLLISGGGTGGHIYPALALAEGLKQAIPDSEFLFVGAQGGLEEKIVPAAGYRLKTLNISGLDRRSPRKAIASVFKIPSALREARRLVKELKPDVVVGTGGYASFPVLYAASRQGIPTAIHEQNAYPGIVNRFLASRVDLVMLTFAEAGDRLKAKRLVTTGLPVREAVLKASEKRRNHKNSRENQVFTLLAFGGSLGAQVINQAVWELVSKLPEDFRVIWVTGRATYNEWQEKLQSIPGLGGQVDIHPYLDDIEIAMAASSLALCRAGASTLAELTIMGLPALLIPYPHAAENHQEKNARALETAGGAHVIINAELNGQRLMDEILAVKSQLGAMALAMRAQSTPNARQQMVALISDLGGIR
ncbi:MAG: undecaprenyldiphospho-muramoylpentapeptide beta-N-acetylglucosaminyltransferase [Methylocystaceae bacterium]